MVILQIINELLKQNELNIYSNPDISKNNLRKFATLFSELDSAEMLDYCNLTKCTSKQCWNNYVIIIDNMDYPQKLHGIPVLFEFLKDMNWPVFQKAIHILVNYPREDILPAVEHYVTIAYEEDDEMWISGISMLVQQLDIKPSEFEKKEKYNYLQYNSD